MKKIVMKLLFKPFSLSDFVKLTFVFIWFYNPVMSQISITEVYYNTPYNEMLRVNQNQDVNSGYRANRHHLGEFVELYNYSDKDINLAEWFLRYKSAKFYLPNKIIKSGQLMVVTYKNPFNYEDFLYYFQLDNNEPLYTADQVIYQSDFMLRNKAGQVSLGQRIKNTNFERIVPNLNKVIFSWHFSEEPESNHVKRVGLKPEEFYKVNSLQYNPIGIYPLSEKPNPLSLPVNIPIQSYDDLVKGFYQANYAYLNYNENIANILNNSCSINIKKSSQLPSDYGSNPTTICFNDDKAGNVTGASTNCNIVTPPNPSTNFTPDVLQAISNDITVYPNPATANSKVFVSWKGNAIGKISEIKVTGLSGNEILQPTKISNLSNPFSFILPTGSTSQYITLFTLTTGQTISKYILKIN